MKRTATIIIFCALVVGLLGTAVFVSNQPTSSSDTDTSQNQTTMDQVQIKDIVVGTGATAQVGDTVKALYAGTLDDGTVFDASSKHGNAPFSFTLGAGQVIKGWDQGIVGMKVGGTRELVIPPDLGYGSSGVGSIPPNSTLHFTVQLVGVTPAGSSSK